jgi:hypothetical protein
LTFLPLVHTEEVTKSPVGPIQGGIGPRLLEGIPASLA